MTAREGPTTATVITPPGRSAVAVVRVTGEIESHPALPSLFDAANEKPLFDQSTGRVIYGQWGTESPEDVVVCRVDAATFEIHCHGGRAASERVLNDLLSVGIPRADGRSQTLGEELQSSLSKTRTTRTADHVLPQCNGAFAAAILSILNAPDSASAIEQIDAILQFAEFGRHLITPWRIVVCGKPNVGKSSLINALVGYDRAIVFDQPGTTRDVVSAETALDGWPMEFVDTAGIRATDNEIESAGISRARSVIAEADARLLLLDVSTSLTAEDDTLLQTVPSPIVVLHKSDLPKVWEWSDLESRFPNARTCNVSSTMRQGLIELQSAIVARLIPVVPPMEAAVPIVDRHRRLLQSARDQATAGDRMKMNEVLSEILEGFDG